MADSVAQRIRSKAPSLGRRRVFIGFDGFIDTLVRVAGKRGLEEEGIFRGIADFGAYLQARNGRSCSIELERIARRSGGNMPNFVRALGRFGCRIDAVGALGYPKVDPAFAGLGSFGRIYSFAQPGSSLCLEFEDGKVMLYEPIDECLSWDQIGERVRYSAFRKALSGAALVGALNWAEMKGATELWAGLLQEMRKLRMSPQTYVLFDLCDCSLRTAEEVVAVCDLLSLFSRSFRVILSLNENEADFLYRSLTADPDMPEIRRAGETISRRLGLHWLVVHLKDRSLGWGEPGCVAVSTRHVACPAISTGGGDNFNAGLSAGLLLGLDAVEVLTFANATSSFYVSEGRSPDLEELASHLDRFGGEYRRG